MTWNRLETKFGDISRIHTQDLPTRVLAHTHTVNYNALPDLTNNTIFFLLFCFFFSNPYESNKYRQ